MGDNITSVATVHVRSGLQISQPRAQGPFDVIGDVHGCADELLTLLETLGYCRPNTAVLAGFFHPDGRQAIFVGDLTDRGPRSADVCRIVMDFCARGAGAMVLGNHDAKLARWIAGNNVRISHGLETTVAEFEAADDAFRNQVAAFLADVPHHLVLDRGRLVVAHAGLVERFHGIDSKAARSFALYGDTTGERDSYGFPVRLEWGRDYRGAATVVYGHTPMRACEWINGTICIDTGCVFGGELTALRWPERELVSVPARQTYWEPTKPLGLRSDAET
ncbi:MAG: metallophosphoesterase [Pseudomonadota bacterium]